VPKKKKIRMVQMEDGVWYKVGRFTHHACCDCGLIHEVKYKWEDGQLWESWNREPKKTDG